ncbi:MAG: YihY/virulence factor BrkB family protein [Epulopiscium sp.]|nr:YihY/virulence factor BrkB family protein [Candidatus Epulonipiscium sp.]
MSKKKLIYLFYDLFCRFREDEVPALGAQLTYYLILSFFPFLIFLLTLLSYTPLTSEQVLFNFIHLVPQSTYELITSFAKGLVDNRSQTLLSFSMLGTLWAASKGVIAVIRGLNKAYDEEETRPFWHIRGIALVYTIALALMIIFTFATLVIGNTLGEYLFDFFQIIPAFTMIWSLIRFLLSLSILILIFAFLYRATPNRQLTLKESIPGALFATFAWIIVSILFSFYVNYFANFSSTYGSIGGIIALLIWLYISSIIIIMGGEFNASLAFLKKQQQKPPQKRFDGRIAFWERVLLKFLE